MKSAAREQKAGAEGATDTDMSVRGAVLQRIIAERSRNRVAPPPGGARPAPEFGIERAAATALGRAAEKMLRLPVFVEQAELAPMTLPELAELLPERALLAVLEGGRDSLGVMALCPNLLTSIIEMQAIGRVTSRPPASRRPTRADAAISADFVNAFLAELGRETAGRPGIPAFATFRYATYMDDPRPLGLMLEDGDMQRLRLKFRVGAGGQRDASILIALPAEPGSGARMTPPQAGTAALPAQAPVAAPVPATRSAPESLAEAVQQAPIRVVGILCRRKLSLQTLRGLGPGSLIPLPQNALDDARLETSRGQVLARGRLGEAEGFHAIRLRSTGDATPAATARPDCATSLAAPRPLGPALSPLPPRPDIEPPIADIDDPDAFRENASSNIGWIGGRPAG